MARIAAILLAVLLASPVAAHSLRVFAKVEGDTISGYAFFIGGGRPSGARWVAKMGDEEVASGETDPEGGYSFSVPRPVVAPVAILVDTGDGHVASARLGAERFGAVAASAKETPAGEAPEKASVAEDAADPPPARPAETEARLVEEAVERQVAPLLERIEAMDARLRFTDVMSGIFLIIGLAGIALWARGRRK